MLPAGRTLSFSEYYRIYSDCHVFEEHTRCNKNMYRFIQVLCTCFPLSACLIYLDFILGNAYKRRTCLDQSIELLLCWLPCHRILKSFFLVFFFPLLRSSSPFSLVFIFGGTVRAAVLSKQKQSLLLLHN